MKNKNLLAIALAGCLLLPAVSNAEDFAGLGFGPNFSGLTNTSSDGISKFTATGFADWAAGRSWFLETGLRYTSYGINGTGSNDLGYSESVNYLEVPILVKPVIAAGGWYPYLIAGPELGIKTSDSLSQNTGSSIAQSSGIFKTLDLSWVFGAGAEIPIGKPIRAFAQFDYELGLLNVLREGSSDTRGAVVSAGAMLPF